MMTNNNTGHNTGHDVLYYKTDGYTSRFNGIEEGNRDTTAQSPPEEKELMVQLIRNFIKNL